MTQETRDYITTWTNKISSYSGYDLGILFDKYSALFTLYNRLYNESFLQMKSKNKLVKPRYSDFEKATRLVVEFNKASDIIDKLMRRNNFEDLRTISNLIKDDHFHINLENGVSRKDIDLILMKNLNSNNPEEKAQAAVATIYHVRCNIQHGEKHFEEQQRILLTPLTRILESIIELQIEKLSE